MFSTLRYFGLVAMVLVIIGAVALSTYFKEVKSDELLATTEQHSAATLHSFVNTIWRKHYAALSATATPPSDFTYDATRFFAAQPLAKITIFSPDVTKLHYGSTNAYVTDNDGSRVTLFNVTEARRGQTSSRILKEAFLSDSGNKPRMLVQTILPIMSEGFTEAERVACAAGGGFNCQPQAMAEIYTDVSAAWAEVKSQQYLIIGAMIGTFAVLIFLLLFTSWRAESIIARQHEVNLELTAAAAQAEAQSRDKSQFLASVSHELRTPLNAIIGFSEIIKNEARGQMDKAYQEYVDDIYASGKHLLSLINDILDFSKAEAGKLQIEWAETDATKVIRNSLRMVMPRAETAQVTLIEDIPSHHLVVVTDPKKLKQVLLNLLSNAVKFTKPGGVVRCHAWEDLIGKALIIQVKDTGIGIAPKDISKVMTPFGQVDSALSRKYEGTGLGLPLSKKFVEAMGGDFAIESELSVGTTITLTIPKAPKEWHHDDDLISHESGADDVAPEQNSTA